MKIYRCNDCGNELLDEFCIDCNSSNVEEIEEDLKEVQNE